MAETEAAPTKIDCQAYVIPGIVDRAATLLAAERRRDKKGETTLVHAHRYDDMKNLCTLECVILEPGYKMRSIGVERTPIEEELY